MRKRLYTLLCGTSLLALTACESSLNNVEEEAAAQTSALTVRLSESQDALFAESDGAQRYSTRYSSAGGFQLMLRQADDNIGTTLGQVEIEEDEYEDIAAEVEAITEGKTTELAKYQAIFNWIVSNVKYDNQGRNTGQTAYNTYTMQLANCQGYSNLMHVMCHAAGLPCINVNGYLSMGGMFAGHAWNAVKIGRNWRICDTTNNQEWLATATSSYEKMLYPELTDETLIADDNFDYGWHNGRVSILRIKTTDEKVTIPYSVKGTMQIENVNPVAALPESVRELYIPASVQLLGVEGEQNLNLYGTHLRAIHVKEDNPYLYSENGVVYTGGGGYYDLYYIPKGIEWVILSDKLTVLGKNAIANLPVVSGLSIPQTVTEIGPSAVENCPNLRLIYAPTNATYSRYDSNGNTITSDKPFDSTFTGLHPDCQIIFGPLPTSIRVVTL